MRFTLQAIIPLYILLNVQSLIFTIINSPSGIQYNVSTESGFHQYEGLQVAVVVISNFFFISTCSAMLALGFSKNAWKVGMEGGSDRESS